MTYKEFLSFHAQKNKTSIAYAEKTVKDITLSITELLSAGEEVHIAGLGTFRLADRCEVTKKIGASDELKTIAAHKIVKFTASKALKEAADSASDSTDA